MLRPTIRRLYRRAVAASPPLIGASIVYARNYGRIPNLRRPQRFTERLFAQKALGDHGRFVDLADKLKVKDYVAGRIGPSFVTPTLWHGSALPSRAERTWPLPFVLKANHGSRMNALVRGAADLDWDALEAKAERWLRTDWEPTMYEDWYNKIERRLFVEPLLEDGSGDLPDYKVFVFSGQAHFIQVDNDRWTNHTRTFYDPRWNRQPIEVAYPPSPGPDPRPRHLDAIVAAAEALGRGFEFVRVDFYDLPDGPRFGEMTFAPGGGLQPLKPDSHDFAWGRLWEECRARAEHVPG